ncbi:TRAP transporter substrate-binding protein [Desulfococcaceae bacterium HSG7]|nr:TRAP transporter substrate-binding protein [Desulfococcaceae bacterium HSG7]
MRHCKKVFAIVGTLAIILMGADVMAKTINIDINCTMKPGGSEEDAIKKFQELVDKNSGGTMKVKIFMSGQLGKEKAVLELMKIGQTQMALTGGLFRTMFAKEYDPITIPFYMPTWKSIVAYLDGPMGKKIGELAEEKGGVLDFGPQKRAPRHMTSNRKITGPDDIKGLKLRLPAIPIWVDVWKEVGSLPTVIPAPEIYLAMKTGQVEAHENSLVSPFSRKLWEVQKYIILTSHVYFPWHWVVSKTWFNKLDPKNQEIIKNAIAEARKYGTAMEDKKDAFYTDELKKKGMEFITPDVAAIRAKAMPAIEKAIKALAPGVAEEVERVSKQ